MSDCPRWGNRFHAGASASPTRFHRIESPSEIDIADTAPVRVTELMEGISQRPERRSRTGKVERLANAHGRGPVAGGVDQVGVPESDRAHDSELPGKKPKPPW